MGSVVQLVVITNTVLNLLSNMIKTIQIISLLLNMWLRLIIWLKCNKNKTTPIPVLNINHLIKFKYGGCCILKYRDGALERGCFPRTKSTVDELFWWTVKTMIYINVNNKK